MKECVNGINGRVEPKGQRQGQPQDLEEEDAGAAAAGGGGAFFGVGGDNSKRQKGQFRSSGIVITMYGRMGVQVELDERLPLCHLLTYLSSLLALLYPDARADSNELY